MVVHEETVAFSIKWMKLCGSKGSIHSAHTYNRIPKSSERKKNCREHTDRIWKRKNGTLAAAVAAPAGCCMHVCENLFNESQRKPIALDFSGLICDAKIFLSCACVWSAPVTIPSGSSGSGSSARWWYNDDDDDGDDVSHTYKLGASYQRYQRARMCCACHFKEKENIYIYMHIFGSYTQGDEFSNYDFDDVCARTKWFGASAHLLSNNIRELALFDFIYCRSYTRLIVPVSYTLLLLLPCFCCCWCCCCYYNCYVWININEMRESVVLSTIAIWSMKREMYIVHIQNVCAHTYVATQNLQYGYAVISNMLLFWGV